MAICFVGVLGGCKEKFSLCKQKIVNEIEIRFVLPSDNTCEDNKAWVLYGSGQSGGKIPSQPYIATSRENENFPNHLGNNFLG